jgi:hypothetical protein
MRALLLTSLVLAAACAAESTPCEQAEQHVLDCGESVPENFAAQCTDDTAEGLMRLDCERISSDGKADGKSDGFLGWKEQGDSCIFNFECSAELVCRPTLKQGTNLGTGDKFCFARGSHRDLCDSDADCEGDLKCINDEFFGDNGFCRLPIP